MKGHDVAAVGRSLPLRGFAGDGDLVIAVARLVADHGTGASLTRQAVAHGVARGFAFDCEVKLSAAAAEGYGFGARSRIAVEARAADRALRVSGMQHSLRKPR
jgi:hypothetical protein